jgi:hypothetical protein
MSRASLRARPGGALVNARARPGFDEGGADGSTQVATRATDMLSLVPFAAQEQKRGLDKMSSRPSEDGPVPAVRNDQEVHVWNRGVHLESTSTLHFIR